MAPPRELPIPSRVIILILSGMICNLFLDSAFAQERHQEVGFSKELSERLDPFEAHQLSQAENQFFAKNHAAARSAYDSFLLEFPKSEAVPFVLLRKGRSLHFENKRFEAIKVYQEVVDYFPNDLPYAAAALYYIGVAQEQNGDTSKAFQTWAKLAEDADYRRQSVVAPAMIKLAQKEENPEQRTKYYRMLAKDYRTTNPQVAQDAINRVIGHHVAALNIGPLREFYVEVGGWGAQPAEISAEDNSWTYWSRIVETINAQGNFDERQRARAMEFFGHWVKTLEAVSDPGVAQARRNYQFRLDGDSKKWWEDFWKSFTAREASAGHVTGYLFWIRDYKGADSTTRQKEVLSRADFSKFTFAEMERLLSILIGEYRNFPLAQEILPRFPWANFSDEQKGQLMGHHQIGGVSFHIAKDIAGTFQNKQLGQMRLLHVANATNQTGPGLELAEQMIAVPEYAGEAMWVKGQLLYKANRFEDAVVVLRQSDRQPHSGFLTSEALVRLGKFDEAVAQLREIESFFEPNAPNAALRIANVYRDAGKKDERIAALRAVLRKYPKSPESNTAHLELEQLGVRRIEGGVDAPQ